MIIPSWIIQKKRDGKELSQEEISGFIRGLSTGEVTDYQATALLMAIYFQKMTLNETVALTQAMLKSGDCYDLSHIPGPKADKHSTGGVGDKVSLILAPLAAACGLRVPMMAGRGLGHSGGTLDKLEAIPGLNVNLDQKEFERVLTKVGCSIVGQTQQIVPADKKLYALRDVTATVECIPLIVGSILSKKLAEGTDTLVLDVKVGSGAFMKTRAEARALAKALVKVAKKLELRCRAVLTDMNQPLGYSVGNSLEVKECIEILRNEKNTEYSSTDLTELTLHLCSQMLTLSGLCRNMAEARKKAQTHLSNGDAWAKFLEIVEEQGGDLRSVLQPENLPIAPKVTVWRAKKRGYITQMETEALGKILVELGGGRKKASDTIDPGVGLLFHKKLGAKVQAHEPLVTVYSKSDQEMEILESQFYLAVLVSATRKPAPKLILEHF